jgi:hypothetical protein
VFESTGAFGQSAKDFFAVLSRNSCNLPDDPTSQDNAFTKLVHAVVIALHRSLGDKYTAAATAARDGNLPGDRL